MTHRTDVAKPGSYPYRCGFVPDGRLLTLSLPPRRAQGKLPHETAETFVPLVSERGIDNCCAVGEADPAEAQLARPEKPLYSFDCRYSIRQTENRTRGTALRSFLACLKASECRSPL